MSDDNAKLEQLELGCCADWDKDALQIGTDNEGYEKLIFIDYDGLLHIGMDLTPISFCPWCGSKHNCKGT